MKLRNNHTYTHPAGLLPTVKLKPSVFRIPIPTNTGGPRANHTPIDRNTPRLHHAVPDPTNRGPQGRVTAADDETLVPIRADAQNALAPEEAFRRATYVHG